LINKCSKNSRGPATVYDGRDISANETTEALEKVNRLIEFRPSVLPQASGCEEWQQPLTTITQIAG
jgi:hypothetical protein